MDLVFAIFQNTLFAGAQFGTECFCGDSYDKHGEASNCDVPCSGDGSEICGGDNANSVLATGKSTSDCFIINSYMRYYHYYYHYYM